MKKRLFILIGVFAMCGGICADLQASGFRESVENEKAAKEKIAVQVIGAPGSGKSVALNDILNFFPKHLTHVIANAFNNQSGQQSESSNPGKGKKELNLEEINKIDLDVFREQTEKLPGREQILLIIQALGSFKGIDKKFDGWLDWCLEGLGKSVNNDLKKKFKEIFGINIQISECKEFQYTDGNAEAKWKTLTMNTFGDFIKLLESKRLNLDEKLDEKLDEIFNSINGFHDLRHALARVRYLALFNESAAAGKSIIFDNIGHNFDDISKTLAQVRKLGFLTLLLAILPQDCSVNIILNAYRAVKDSTQYANPENIVSFFTQLDQFLRESANAKNYRNISENVLEIKDDFGHASKTENNSENVSGTGNDSILEKGLYDMDTKDNLSRKSERKAADLLIIDRRKTARWAIDILKDSDEADKIKALIRGSIAMAKWALNKKHQDELNIKEQQKELDRCIASLKALAAGSDYKWLDWSEQNAIADRKVIEELCNGSLYIKKVWDDVLKNTIEGTEIFNTTYNAIASSGEEL
ncbi:MAG: hypothetical protein LBU04_04390 [Christensenellaceae bacterium]|jgi:ABC-type dipeptide/oligopeptide/nickel transport system ATPase component|nr:hypothetical protein [Christensenellaceae bacterium]